jgi:hypothetical protein
MLIKIGARYPFGACSYYRSYGVFPHLHRLDQSIRVEPITQIDWTYIAGADILYLERPQDPEYVSAMKLAKNFGVKTWVDYDDDLFSVPDYNPTKAFYGKKEVRQSIIKALETADVVTVATQSIKDVYSKYNSNIHVIPNAFNNYNLSLHDQPSKNKKIAWRGSQTHRGDIIPVTREIVKLSNEYKYDFFDKESWMWLFFAKDLWYVVDYMKPGSYRGFDEMQIQDYFKKLKNENPAIFVCPLEMNVFNASKSNCAWLEATFSGACCVAPVLPEFDKPGIEHYYTSGEFYDKVKMLINNPERRAANFQASLKYIQKNLLLSDVNHKRLDVARSVIYGS